MRLGRMLRSVVVGTMLLWVASAVAQQVRFFPDFSSVANLQFTGNAHQATWSSAKVLRLTDGYSGIGIFHPENSTAWFELPGSIDPNLGRQPVNKGFTTYFKFQIHNAAICCTPADGLAFVVQNSSTTARGSGSGGLGYSGIPNSLAVEFDTFQNPWDPSPNHVAVQSCGTLPNSPVHTGSCLVGSGISSSIPHLGVTCGSSGKCTDGVPHEAVVEYTAPPLPGGNGTLMVWIDPPFIPGTHTPCPNNTTPGCPVAAVAAINIPYNIDSTFNPSQGISLTGGTSAWVGFSASQTTDPQAQDILAWEFTPHAATAVQQPIPPGGTEAHYTFGSNDTVVDYFPGFTNNGCDGTTPSDPCLMTVLATPISRNDFDRARLQGTPFANEECVVYLGTGGKCIVYSITCQKTSSPTQNVTCPASLPNTCNNIGDPGCIVFSTSFYTADPVTPTNADYLKADPIGTNNWISIFQSYQPNIFDGKTTGTGGSSSDFVATFNPNLP